MSDKVRLPPRREQSVFYKTYHCVPAFTMLQDFGFQITETPIDDEDIVYMEQYKEFLLTMGIVEERVPFRREFVAEYPVSSTTSLCVEGYYLRKPTGEKMFTSYYYDYYFRGYRGIQEYCQKATKSTFLHVFEKKLKQIRK